MKFINDFLNGKPMYRLLLEGLAVLAGLSIFFGLIGLISKDGVSLLLSLAVICLSCYVVNYLCASIVSASKNFESVFITAFILFFILAPATNAEGFATLALAGALAMASKYILAMGKKHIFNPAAIAIFILALLGKGYAIWWVATLPLLPFVAFFGFLILKKIDKFRLFFIFLAVASLSSLGFALAKGAEISGVISQMVLSWPIIFFGTVMLTEPLTTPPSNKQQFVYAAIIGLLFGAQFHLGPIYSTPALALVVGNIFSYLVAPKYFARLILHQKNQLTADIYEFIFSAANKLSNVPGQYMEWTLPHKNTDNRGNRRYFTIASSPTEGDIRIGVRVSPEKSSSFKKALLSLNVGDSITASRLVGNFTLPKEQNKKLAFIAGGIGITPFRSMVKYLTDTGAKRQATLLYSAKTENDFVYKDVFDQASDTVGLKTVYVLGRIDEELIRREIPDYKERAFYISGPSSMVTGFKTILKSTGVAEENINTDFFPGFA